MAQHARRSPQPPTAPAGSPTGMTAAAARLRRILLPTRDSSEPAGTSENPLDGHAGARTVTSPWLSVAVIAVIAVVGLVVAVVVWARSGSAPEVVIPPARAMSLPGSPAVAGGLGGPSPGSTAGVTVHVVGQVRRPGVVTLTPGARVADAVRATGGVARSADLRSVNLARVLHDGEQIVVGAVGSAAPGPVSDSSAQAASSPINLNTATVEQLESLPGVGPVLAGRIIGWRTEHGSFTSVNELREVSGIGDSKFADLSKAVTV
jgi:competence protein ComEA